MSGHEYLCELLPEFPEITAIWQPCEAHPRPEEGWGPHSDIILRGLYYILENELDIYAYHNLMYKAPKDNRVDIEDIASVAEYIKHLTDPETFRKVLGDGAYIEELKMANHHAFDESGVWFIPAFRMNGEKLDSKGGVGVTKKELKLFLEKSVQR